jgi:hypothetical protein
LTNPAKGDKMYSNRSHDTQKQGSFKVPTLEEIREARKKRVIITMLCAYGDDSSDEEGVRTFAVAGIAGTQEEWDIIKPAWIKATEGRIFHATDNQSGFGVYEGISKTKRDEEYIKLTDILIKSKMIGYGHVADIAAFKENLPDTSEDAPYYHCFVHVIMGFAKIGYMSIPREKVKFTFDRNLKVKYNSNLMLDFLTTLSEYDYSEYIERGEVSFASNEMVQIQAADLFAYEIMKELDNQIGPIKRDRRKPLIALKRTGRFRWAAYTRRDFEFIRKELEYLEKEDNLDWRQEYQKWLMKTKRKIDNDSNRMSYMLYLRQKMEKEKKGNQVIAFPVASNQGNRGCD